MSVAVVPSHLEQATPRVGSPNMSRPTDFFIVGAAKCGTTGLFRSLAAHPAVFMPENKEPNFFCSDIPTLGAVETSSQYQALFAAAPSQALTGEASVMYLFSKVAIARIMAYNPKAKIIVMLRHPIEAARSMHASQLRHDQENVADFEQAWGLQALRLGGQALPPRWPYPETLQYGGLYLYAPQVRRVLEQVPRAQCLFVISEEFFADPHLQFARVLEFLGLPPDPARTTFPVANQAVGVRSALVARLLRHPPRSLAPASRALRRVSHALGVHPLRSLQRFNTIAGWKPPLRESFRLQLERYFSADVAELEQLLGRTLWNVSTEVSNGNPPSTNV
jgi:Sulfotransferase domain